VTDRGDGVCVVTVSFNTIELTSLLVWSLHRMLDDSSFDVLVVENGSSDGSAGLLAKAADAGLCRLLTNDQNVHHGPALNQAMESLVTQQSPPRRVWIVDSDVVISRGDALRAALEVAEARSAAIVGERHWDQWKQKHRFELYSLLIDLSQVWRPGAPTFQDAVTRPSRSSKRASAQARSRKTFPSLPRATSSTEAERALPRCTPVKTVLTLCMNGRWSTTSPTTAA
jgi:hypothetical protein